MTDKPINIKPDREHYILFLLFIIVVIAVMSSCNVVRTIVLPPIQYPATVLYVEIAHNSLGTKYSTYIVSRRNRGYWLNGDVLYEPGHVFESEDELFTEPNLTVK